LLTRKSVKDAFAAEGTVPGAIPEVEPAFK
jgi:hypothetical protein